MRLFRSKAQPEEIFTFGRETYYLLRDKDNPLPVKSYFHTANHSLILLNVLDDIRGGSLYVYDGELEVARMHISVTDNQVLLRRLHVRKDYRYEGIGRTMMNCLVRWCRYTKKASLETRPSAPISRLDAEEENRLCLEDLRSFYRGFGLTVERGKNLYNTTENLTERHYLVL